MRLSKVDFDCTTLKCLDSGYWRATRYLSIIPIKSLVFMSPICHIKEIEEVLDIVHSDLQETIDGKNQRIISWN